MVYSKAYNIRTSQNNYKVRGTVRNISFSETIKSDIKKYFDSSFDIEFLKQV